MKTAKGTGQNPWKVSGLLDEARDALGTVSDESAAEVFSEIAEVIAEHDPERACGMLREAAQKGRAPIQPGEIRYGNPLPELAKGMTKSADDPYRAGWIPQSDPRGNIAEGVCADELIVNGTGDPLSSRNVATDNDVDDLGHSFGEFRQGGSHT